MCLHESKVRLQLGQLFFAVAAVSQPKTSRGGRWTPGKGHHCPGKEVVVVHE
ncbi:hypothetical protein TYRP_013734 [Tyrophagus putrescentiae]|nr:hypothetical protein TYRP_013734 [Tyrophagus putrescentiae]